MYIAITNLLCQFPLVTHVTGYEDTHRTYTATLIVNSNVVNENFISFKNKILAPKRSPLKMLIMATRYTEMHAVL